jgi:predicted aspartyl protease
MADKHDRLEVTEQFTFRANGFACTVDEAIIDTGAQMTCITQRVVEALKLQPIDDGRVSFTGESGAKAKIYNCVVAWTIYEQQRYYSARNVYCIPGADEVLIGFDFLSHHQLTVDMEHRGLIGTAPRNAEPLTGGGHVLNAPRGFVLKYNAEVADAAKPGDILRPHPYWRFVLPAMIKQ